VKSTKTKEMQNLLQEEYFKTLDEIEEGQVVSGHVVQVNNEFVFVDVGYKSEGRIPIIEFTEAPSVGETVSVVFVSKEGKGGQRVCLIRFLPRIRSGSASLI